MLEAPGYYSPHYLLCDYSGKQPQWLQLLNGRFSLMVSFISGLFSFFLLLWTDLNYQSIIEAGSFSSIDRFDLSSHYIYIISIFGSVFLFPACINLYVVIDTNL